MAIAGRGASVRDAAREVRRSRARRRRTRPAVACRDVGVRFFTDRRSVTALVGHRPRRRRAARFLTLLGPSGCGKSTLAARGRRPGVAERRARSASSAARAEAARRRRDIGFVFQDPALLALAHRAAERRAAAGSGGRREAQGQGARRRELLELVGLKGWEQSYPARAVRRHAAARVDRARAASAIRRSC